MRTSTGYEYLAARLVDELNRERLEASATNVVMLDADADPTAPAPVYRPPLEVRCRYFRPRQELEVAIVEPGDSDPNRPPVAAIIVTREVLGRVNGHVLRFDVEAGLRADMRRRARAREAG